MATVRCTTSKTKPGQWRKPCAERVLLLAPVLTIALVVFGTEALRRWWDGDIQAVRPHYKVGAPYRINGMWYRPAEDLAYGAVGVASFYGGEAHGLDFHGRPTANGEVYDMYALSAAHPTLPMPSVVNVINLENGRSVVLRVNDRGPFVAGRIIDVSRRAAQDLGFERQGTARVRVEVLATESSALKRAMLRGEPPATATRRPSRHDTRRAPDLHAADARVGR